MDADLVVDRARSTSYVPGGPAEQRAALADQIRSILAGFDGTFAFPHLTTTYSCRRA